MPKCDFNKVASTLLKSHFGMSVLYICCIFSETFLKNTSGRLLSKVAYAARNYELFRTQSSSKSFKVLKSLV